MKKFILRKKKLLFILLIIAIVFFGGKNLLFDSKKNISDFATVKRADIKEELTLSGKIDTDDHVVLKFAIPGRVNWVGVKEGDWVREGQAIATLDKEVLDANLREAWQSFTAAKASSDKYYDGRSGDSESYDEKIKRTALDAAQNIAYDNIRIAQENLKSATLYSPIEGLVVGADPAKAGVNVSALNSGYEIVDPSTVFLKVTADQTEVGSLSEKEKGSITFDSYPSEKITGEIRSISFTPSTDETGTVYDIKVEFLSIDNSDYNYRLGMTADMDFITKEKTNVLIIPAKYIKDDDKGKYVLVGKGKKKTYVKTGIEDGQDIEITGGLSEGDVVYD